MLCLTDVLPARRQLPWEVCSHEAYAEIRRSGDPGRFFCASAVGLVAGLFCMQKVQSHQELLHLHELLFDLVRG
jgi:hypothetical protein